MGFSKEKQLSIKNYILEKIEYDSEKVVSRTAEAFSISLNTVYRYLRELEKEGILIKSGKKYLLKGREKHFLLRREKGEVQEEDIIYEKCIKEFVEDLPSNVKQIWQYSFMEMMNNAIDHSQAECVMLSVYQNYINTVIMIFDNGVGIFKKIKEYYQYASLDDAVNELFKGKLTTDSKNHSGEGIFFTSRVLDRFAALSDGKIFTHDNYSELLNDLDDIEELKKWRDNSGTIILMCLSNHSNKTLKEVFDMFADVEGGFIRTRIPIKNIFDTFPVSRSQAKRLSHRFDSFQEIELDFDGVQEIGQGFAHEIFVVFQNNHKNIKIIPINTSEDVMRMINHVKRGNE